MIWNPDLECMPREEIEFIQPDRLKATLRRVDSSVEFYRNSFERRDGKTKRVVDTRSV